MSFSHLAPPLYLQASLDFMLRASVEELEKFKKWEIQMGPEKIEATELLKPRILSAQDAFLILERRRVLERPSQNWKVG